MAQPQFLQQQTIALVAKTGLNKSDQPNLTETQFEK